MRLRITARAAHTIAAACGLALVCAVSSPEVRGQQADRARTEALSRRVAERMQALRQEADRLASQERTLIGDLRTLEIDRQIKHEASVQATTRADAVAGDLAAVDEQVARLEREDVAERPELNARLVELYKLGQGRYLRLLLSVSDVRGIGQASRMVSALALRDRERIASHQKRLVELETARTTLQVRAKELTALRADADRARAAADRVVTARNALIRSIDSQRDLNAQLAGELQAAQQKLQGTLRGLASGTAATEPIVPLGAFRGDLDWPVAGSVRYAFGRSVSGRPASNGIEIAATEGAQVHAVHDGTVAFADVFAGYGKLVIVDHGAQTFTLYGNLLDVGVTQGTRVAHGDLVGTVGPALTSSAPANGPDPAAGPPAGLYFELRVDGHPVDPVQWLRKR